MNWLNEIVDTLIERHPEGEITVSSGVSPSGTYHLGTLREVLTAEIVARELQRRGREARHIHVADDLDVFRKVPVNIPESFAEHLGKPLCDVPAPDGSAQSYADYFLNDLLIAAKKMNLQMQVIRAHEKYRSGYFVPVIEKSLQNTESIRTILEQISGRKLDDQWSPVQIVEGGYLKNRAYKAIDTNSQMITYVDKDGNDAVASYADGHVKLSWRIDWPARWSMLGVHAEPFGRDHATKGGSYDTGVEIVRQVFGSEPPYPIPYHFINRTGETKKMSKSAGNVITAAELLDVLPPEIVWFFIIRYAPDKQLFFDEGEALMKLFDEFSALLAKPDKTEHEQHLLDLCMQDVDQPTVSNIPFTHLVASYQASLRDVDTTIEIIKRTEHAEVASRDADIIRNELQFIDAWLDTRAPEDVKFTIAEHVDAESFDERARSFMRRLADVIDGAPENADGEWFHLAIYRFKEEEGYAPKELFTTLYRALIGQDSGPRAGWFLSILPREWLLKRLRLES